MPAKTSELPPELVQFTIQNTRLIAQDICALFQAPDWWLPNSRNEQVVFVFDLASSDCGIGLSNHALARVFGCTPQHVSKIGSKARKVQKPPHSPLKLNEDRL
jgi:hypothetical protein